VRSEGDKYVRRFSPDEDELYFDLVRDPGEQSNAIADHPERVRALQARAEEFMASNPFRYVVEVEGRGPWMLHLETGGWFENVEAEGLAEGESWTPGGNGRWVRLQVGARPDAPRRLSFTVRPRGAPVTLSGTHAERPLRPDQVSVAASAWQPPSLPFRLPDLESEAQKDDGLDLVTAPPPGDGVRVFVTLPEGETLMELDEATRERLQALGYLDP
jgi:hypothetical protein